MNKQIVLIVMLVVLSATIFPVTGLLPTKAGNTNYSTHTTDGSLGLLGPNDLWPMFRNDAGNTGCTDNYGTNTNHVAWEKQLYANVGEATPVLYGDKIYVSTGWYYKGFPKMSDLFDTNPPPASEIIQGLLEHPSDIMQGLFCRDADTGEEIWNKSLGYPNNPAVVDNKVYITSIDINSYTTFLYCFDAATGEFQWQKTIDGLVLSPTIISDGKIFLGCLNYYSYASSIKCYDISGNYLWSHSFNNYEISWFSAPAVSGQNVYCITVDLYTYYSGNVYCLNAENGAPRWSKPISTLGFLMYYQAASPACYNGNVYLLEFDIYTYGGSLKCYDGDTGNIKWNKYLGESITLGTPAVCADGVYISVFNLNTYSNRLYRYDPLTGDLQWSVTVPYSSYFSLGSSPICSADKILLSPGAFYDYSMELYCFEKENGTLTWNYIFDSYILGLPSIGENRVYAVDYFGNLYMFEDILKIKNVIGGIFGINAIIQNTGDTSLTDITWTISVNGGTLSMVNRTQSGTIQQLRPGGIKIIRLIPVLGFGKIEVITTATMPSMNLIKKTKQGFVFGSFCMLPI